MHLARPNFLHQGPGVWGDKSQVLFVNDKAIISLVLHRGKKKILQQRFKQGSRGRRRNSLAGKVFFLFFCFAGTNKWAIESDGGAKTSRGRTCWQAAPAQVLYDSGREDRKKLRSERGGKNRGGGAKRQEREQRGGDKRKERTQCVAGRSSLVLGDLRGL